MGSPQPIEEADSAGRQIGTVLASVLGGACFGTLDLVGQGPVNEAVFFGGMFGAIVGLLLSPALLLALRYGPWRRGLLVVFVPTAAITYVVSAGSPGETGPVVGFFFSVATFLAVCAGWSVFAWKVYRPNPKDTCRACGYPREGLGEGAVCPECGRAFSEQETG